jgi:hypothetical protein
MPPITDTRKFAVRIDGTTVPVKNVSGAYPKAVVQTTIPAAGPPTRQISSFRYVDLRFDVGVGMGTPIRNWVTSAFAGNSLAKNGTIIELNDVNRAVSYLDFSNAKIVEFGFPRADVSSSDEGSFTVVLSVGGAAERPGDNALITPPTVTNTLLVKNFRLTIGGLPTTRVGTIAPIPFRWTSSRMLPADLVITVPNIDAGPWRAWVKDFIVDGHNDQTKEKQGAIEWLPPNLSTVIAKLAIKQIGIFEWAPVANATLRTYSASMYFEFGEFSLP